MRRIARSMTLLAVALVAACDPSARTETRAGAPPPEDRRSREHETCSRSSDCAAELRCIDAVCRPSTVSVQGELFAAVGERALAGSKPREAAEAFAAAVSHYETDKLDPPAHLFCAQGRAILHEPGVAAQRLELAARMLHRCLLGAPVGSDPYRRAMGDLAGLIEHGLDPAVLARTQLADVYLSGAAPPPALDKLTLAVDVKSKSRSATLRRVTKYLQEKPEVLGALASCWKSTFDKTRDPALRATLNLKYGYDLDEFDDFERSWIKLPEIAGADEQTACARAVLLPLLDAEGRKIGEESRWDATITFTVQPPG
ncbi:MAG TPA: hypothetical protein VMZ28_30435 [Kofleriaceae bacterium]|nr:hypothetical protein [Kofleriaceae bacterium]